MKHPGNLEIHHSIGRDERRQIRKERILIVCVAKDGWDFLAEMTAGKREIRVKAALRQKRQCEGRQETWEQLKWCRWERGRLGCRVCGGQHAGPWGGQRAPRAIWDINTLRRHQGTIQQFLRKSNLLVLPDITQKGTGNVKCRDWRAAGRPCLHLDLMQKLNGNMGAFQKQGVE